MEIIKEVILEEGVIHVLDNSGDEPLLNEYTLDLKEETYNFLIKHIEKCLRDEELRYAHFNDGRSMVKELCFEHFEHKTDFLTTSKELSRQMFGLIKSKGNIPSCDLVIVKFSSEQGPFIGIMKMDYVKNFIHHINFVEDKLGIDIIPQYIGLPGSSQKIQKCAFIRPRMDNRDYDLLVIDKQTAKKEDEDYGSNYFIGNFLNCSITENERDMTKGLVKAAELWTRDKLKENAPRAEEVRSGIKRLLKEEDNIDVRELSQNLFKEEEEVGNDFFQYVTSQGVKEEVIVDKDWVDKKLKRIRLKIDKDIDLYINSEVYEDINRFEVKRNGDGTLSMIIKHVRNYEER